MREISTYPWSGDIRIEVEPERAQTFALKLRIPGWAKSARAAVNGAEVKVEAETDNGYLTIARQWTPGDVVTLDLPMPAERIYAHPAVRMDAGRVALKRGPLVYCAEEVDNPQGPVQQLKLPRRSEIKVTPRRDLFDGVVTLTADAVRVEDGDWGDSLYRAKQPAEEPTTLTALPYSLWNNRQKGSMMVWLVET